MLVKKVLLYATELAGFEFCQMYYYHMKNKTQISKEIENKFTNGTKVHSDLFNEHYKNTSKYALFDSAVLDTLKDGIPRIIRELRISRVTDTYELRARIDEVRIEPDRIVIVDDKHMDYLEDHLRQMYMDQLTIYAKLFYENYFPFLDVYIELRKAKEQKKDPDLSFIYEQFNTQKEYSWEQSIDKIVEYWSGDEEKVLEMTVDRTKSEQCIFRSACFE